MSRRRVVSPSKYRYSILHAGATPPAGTEVDLRDAAVPEHGVLQYKDHGRAARPFEGLGNCADAIKLE